MVNDELKRAETTDRYCQVDQPAGHPQRAGADGAAGLMTSTCW
jgi:hypothetical protein